MELNLNTYNVRKIRCNTVAAGKQNAGQHYVTMTVRNSACFAEAAFDVQLFDEDLYEELKNCCTVSNGGIVPDGQPTAPIPAEYTQIHNAVFCVYKFKGGNLVRCDANGAPVLKNGIPQTNDHCTVFCIATSVLPDGTICWAKGWDPQTRGQQIERHFYLPPSATQQTAAPDPMASQTPAGPAQQQMTDAQRAALEQLNGSSPQQPVQF